jgi:hypothetical protein
LVDAQLTGIQHSEVRYAVKKNSRNYLQKSMYTSMPEILNEYREAHSERVQNRGIIT